MMGRTRLTRLLVTLVVLLGIGQAHLSAVPIPMGTAFTYQGRFTSGGSPANGSFDFEFSLFDAATTGSQVGDTVTKTALSVSDGYFTTTLDFGSGAFTGSARWLQIAVRPAGQGSYTPLTPRHELTPTPYSLYPSVLGTAGYFPKFTSTGLADSVVYESNGNIGIGTTSPNAKLTVQGSDLFLNWGAGSNGGDLRLGANLNQVFIGSNQYYSGAGRYSRDGGSSYINFDVTTGSNGGDISFLTAPSGTAGNTGTWTERMRIKQGGSVGIGTTSPVYRLHVSTTANNIALFETTGLGAVIHLKNSDTTASEAIARSGDDLDLRTNLTPRLTVKASTGYIGIGSSAPTQMLDVSGTVRCVSLVQTSDVQLKTDIQPLGTVLDKLDRVRAVSFRWNEKAQPLGVKTDARQIGVLAQELEQVFPELVVTPEPTTVDKLLANYPAEMLTAEFRQRLQEDADKTQYKAVRYSELTTVLLEAVKELRAQNSSLEQRIQALESKVK